MLVRTYFDSKYQLASNLDYYNALLSDENYASLADIFEISEEELENVKLFELVLGPESENDRIIRYDAD